MLSYLVLLLAASEFRDPLLPLWAMEMIAKGFLYAWLFCMGATVGSFLNVVVYRLPRGKNLAYPGSFCPRCGHAIRLNDNVPILSWLALRGRCRDCGGRISSRYFFVELATAAMFLIVLACEHYLPVGAFGAPTRPRLTPYDGVPFWCMYATHVGLITTIFCCVLIAADGFPVDRRLFLPIIVVAFALPILWPQMRSVAAATYTVNEVWWTGLVDGLAGLAAALVFRLFILALRTWQPATTLSKLAPLGWTSAVGIVVGWQRSIYALPITGILIVCSVLALRRARRDSPVAPIASANGEATSAVATSPSGDDAISADHSENVAPPAAP